MYVPSLLAVARGPGVWLGIVYTCTYHRMCRSILLNVLLQHFVYYNYYYFYYYMYYYYMYHYCQYYFYC